MAVTFNPSTYRDAISDPNELEWIYFSGKGE